MYYLIYDLVLDKYLTDEYYNLVKCYTIKDCLDYLEYVLNIDYDETVYKFYLRGNYND